jgi:hypothetical protein
MTPDDETTIATDDDSSIETSEGPPPEPDVPDQTDPGSFSDPEPEVPENQVDVSDIEEGPPDEHESVSRLQRPSVSVARARRHTSGFSGQCLHFVWRCLDGQHKYGLPDANAAFRASKHLRTTGTPPAGVPVYFLGSKHGHVALSVGGGRIRSTDWPSRNRISEVKITDLAKAWGRRYAGWAPDMAGHMIPGVVTSTAAAKPTSHPYPGHATKRDDKGATVKVVQDRLNHHGARIPEDGRFGPATENAVKKFQGARRLEVDGRVGPKTWAALWR